MEPIGRIHRDLARDIVFAIEANMFRLYETLGQIPNSIVDSGPDMLRVKTGLPHEFLNAIFRARITEQRPEAAIRSALEIFRSDRTPVMWWVGPSTEPQHLGKFLENSGLAHAGDLSGMAIDLESLQVAPAIPRELSVEPVRDGSTLQTWLQSLAIGYEIPEAAISALFDFLSGFGFGSRSPFRHYLGSWKGHPVATSTLFFGAGVAGIYITVIPEYRRQGIGVAMTLVPLRAARAAGYRVAVTHVPGYRVGLHRKLGFKPHCTLSTYVPRDLARRVNRRAA